MKIREFMTPNPITVEEDLPLIDATVLMKERKIRRLPVVSGNKILGIVTDRDIRSASPSQVINFDNRERELMPELHDMLADIKVNEIMSKNVTTISQEKSITAAASIMMTQRISGMPVVDSAGDNLVGIITEGDVFKALADISGMNLGNTILGFRLEDTPGSIKDVTDIMRGNGVRLASIMAAYSDGEPENRNVYFRIRDIPDNELAALKVELEKKFELLYIIRDDIDG